MLTERHRKIRLTANLELAFPPALVESSRVLEFSLHPYAAGFSISDLGAELQSAHSLSKISGTHLLPHSPACDKLRAFRIAVTE
jgi:hypothetical protein